MAKILFVTMYETGALFHAAVLELVEEHLENGDTCSVVSCMGKKIACDYNPKHGGVHCLSCNLQTKRGNALLSSEVKRSQLSDYILDSDLEQAEKEYRACVEGEGFHKDVVTDSFDWGAGVFSTVVSHTRELDGFRFQEQHPKLTRSLALSSFVVYRTMLRILDEEVYDKVYFFNGRHASLRGIRRACEKRKVAYAALEGGFDLNHYGVFENSTPHDIKARNLMMMEQWKNEPDLMRGRAADFYAKRLGRVETNVLTMRSFTRDQELEKLPDSWDPNRHNVAIFCSSEDEYVSIGEQWNIPIYSGQAEALERIAASLSEMRQDGIKVYLRVHPNLKGIYNEFVRRIENLKKSCIEVIPADSSVDTYALMLAASTVVSFGSSVGIEAAYFKKPSVLLGASLYRELGSCYLANSHEEVVSLLTRKLDPLSIEGAEIYGGHMLSFGREFRDTQVGDSVAEAVYKGVNLNGNWFHRTLLRAYRRRVNHISRSIQKSQQRAARDFEAKDAL